jgi:ribosomal protein L7Ae-like RNA K-turn-binding protein
MTDTQSNYLYFYCSNLQNVEAYQSLCEKNKIPVLFFSNYEEISQAIRSQLPLGIIFDQKSLFGISNDLKMFIYYDND